MMNRFTLRKFFIFTFFLLIAVLFESKAQTLYSYASGHYSDTATWTTDPSGTTYVISSTLGSNKPENAPPNQSPKIKLVILPGRTVTLDKDIDNSPSITIQAGGILNFSTFAATAPLSSLSGQGTLRISKVVGGIAYFPEIDLGNNTFTDAGGGTVEYDFSGTAQLNPSQATYNNLSVNLGNTTDILFTLHSLTLNGSLSVGQGTFRISDDTAPSIATGDKRLKLDIKGDVTVASTGSITVGKANTNTSLLTADEFNGTTFTSVNGNLVVVQNFPGPFKIAGGANVIGPIPNKFSYHKVYHQIFIGGNFTNSGKVKLHNLTKINLNEMSGESGLTNATTGAATVFFQGAADKTVTCNNYTDFYSLIVDKGGDPTYKLTINATNAPATASYFRVWGPNTLQAETAGNTEDPNPFMRKALWVKNGTLRLIGSTIIPSLTEGTTQGPVPNSDYYIPTNAGILVDGPNAVLLTTADYNSEIDIAYNLTGTTGVTSGDAYRSSLSMYGSLQINSGYVSTRESSGFIYWNADGASANLIMNGGVLDTKQIRPSFSSSSNRFTFIMTGGTIRLRGSFQNFGDLATGTPVPVAGNPVSVLSALNLNKALAKNGTQANFATFFIYLESSIFTMTGGNIDIFCLPGGRNDEDAQDEVRKAIDINSSVGNYNVTGGSFNIYLNGSANLDKNYYVASSAPLANLNVYRQSGNQSVILTGITSGYIVSKQPDQPLTILNNLTIESGILNANSRHNVLVGGSFEVKQGASFITGTGTSSTSAYQSLIFNGSGSQGFINSGFITTDGTTAGLMNLVINKPANTSLTLARSTSFSQPLSFVVNKNFSLLSGNLDDGGRTLRVKGNVNNSGKHLSPLGGSIMLNGGSNQIISSNNLAGGVFGNLKLNNTTATFSTAHTVTGKLIFEGTTSILDIGIYALELTSGFGDAITYTDSPFSNTKMIKTAGNQSDDGIRKRYMNNGEFLFPFGTGTIYTPASIQINTPFSNGAYGTISVRPVVGDHPFITASPALPYYWKVLTNGGTNALGESRGSLPANGAISVSHKYYYYGLADNVTYIPGRYLPNAWTSTTNVALVDEATDEISFINVPYLTEDFTAGIPAAFNAVTTYYSRVTGNWDTNATWTLDTLVNATAPGTPTAQNPTIIRSGHTVTVNSNNKRSGSMNIQSGATLDVTTSTGHNFGAIPELEITGSGKLRISSSSAVAEFPAGDFGNFISAMGGTVEYYTTGTVNFTLPLTSSGGLSLETYRNLTLSPTAGQSITFPDLAGTNDRGLIILQDLTVSGNSTTALAKLSSGSVSPTRSLTVNGNINVTGGRLRFMANTIRNVVLDGLRSKVTPGSYGNITIGSTTNGAGLDMDTDPAGGTNTMIVSGSVKNGNVFDLKSNVVCNVTFIGESSTVIEGTGTTTDFNFLIINKGTSMVPMLTVTATNFTANSSISWLTLQNGTFRLEKPGTFSVAKATGNAFTIPATAAFSLNHDGATVEAAAGTQDASDLKLDGKLEILKGKFYVGQPTSTTNVSNDIEYAEVGSPTIVVSGTGELFVKGQIRRSLNNVLGSLHYIQTGGSVTVGGRIGILSDGPPTYRDQAQALNLRRAKLEVMNAGSEFNMSGGTLTILRGGGFTDWYGDLYLRPDASSTIGNGGTILLGPGTASVGPQTYTLDSSIPLTNLIVKGVDATNTSTVNMAITPLVLQGSLTISDAFSTLNTNSLNVSIGGNFSNNGLYLAGNNTTTFTGNGVTATFNTPTSFNHLIIKKAITFAGSGNRAVIGDLTMDSGASLNDGSLNIPTVVLGNVINSGTHMGNALLSLQKGVKSIIANNNVSYSLPTIKLIRNESTRPADFRNADMPAEFNVTIIDGVIKSITLSKGGTNFKEDDQLLIQGGTGTGATATFTTGVSSGGSDRYYPVTQVLITNGGSGYGPITTVTGGNGSGMVVQTILRKDSISSSSSTSKTVPISEIKIISPGTGYTTEPIITISGANMTANTGTVQMNDVQTIAGDGKGQFGTLELNNPQGVNLIANTTVNKSLQFASGITEGLFYINDNLLTLGKLNSADGSIGAIIGANENKYIRTNGVISDKGVRKYFSNGGTPQSFTFPLGVSGKYTPATYSPMTVSQAGSLTVKPVNSEHPATTDFTADNALDYYWNVTAGDGFVASALTHTYKYLASDVSLEAGKTEADYISGRLISGDLNWTQGSESDVDETNHIITFTNNTNLTADYTAGTAPELAQIATYYSRQSGDWDAGNSNTGWTTWSADPIAMHSGAAFTGKLPSNAKFIVAPNHIVNTNGNGRNAWVLNLKGTLDIGSTIFNNFGTISGNGRLRISSKSADFTFPGGNYDAFVSPTGGTVEYYGDKPGGVLTQKEFNNIEINTSSTNQTVNLINDIVVNGTVSILSGQLNNAINNRNIELKGNWNTYGTTGFTPGNGNASVYFTGTASQTITGPTTFNHILFSEGTSKILAANSNLAVNGDITIGSGVTVNNSGNNTLVLNGNWYNSGTFNAGNGTASVILNGGDQVIGGTSTTTLNNLTINGGSSKTLEKSISVNGVLTLTKGYLITNSTNLLTMNAGSSVAGGSLVSTGNSGGSQASFVVGPMEKIGNTNFFFPIGKFVEGSYRLAPAHIGSLSNSTTFRAEYFGGEYNNSSRFFASPLTGVSNIEYWNITASTSTSTQITLTWRATSNVRAGEYVYVTNFNSGQWTNPTPADGIQASAAIDRVTSASITNLGLFTLGYRSSDYTPTPVTLLSFEGKWNDGQVDLKWITASEKNNAYFSVERSTDGSDFTTIGQVDGNGTTNITQVYHFSDTEPLSGITYYRIKQVDIDGQYEYSRTISIANPDQDAVTLFPNPSSSEQQVQLQISNNEEKEYAVAIYDLQGRQLSLQTHAVMKGLSNVPVSHLQLATGMYIVRVFANNAFVKQFKLIIN